MALQLRQPPKTDNREEERFQEELYWLLSKVGTRTLDLGLIAAGTVSPFTITVNGARVGKGQTVLVTPPSTIEADLMWCGFISADDTVTVRVLNPTGSGIDPASGEWSARVLI